VLCGCVDATEKPTFNAGLIGREDELRSTLRNSICHPLSAKLSPDASGYPQRSLDYPISK
jgi:hypothetical protein